MPGSGDGVLDDSIEPRIVRLEQRVVVWSTHALGEAIMNDVAGNKLIAIWRKADGQPIADQQAATGWRGRGRAARRRCRRWRRDTRGQHLRSGGIEAIIAAGSHDFVAA